MADLSKITENQGEHSSFALDQSRQVDPERKTPDLKESTCAAAAMQSPKRFAEDSYRSPVRTQRTQKEEMERHKLFQLTPVPGCQMVDKETYEAYVAASKDDSRNSALSGNKRWSH